MGYQITWKTSNLPEKVKEDYKPSWKHRNGLLNQIEICKQELIITCTNYNKEKDIDIKSIKFKLDLYKNLLIENWKFDLQERLNDEELWFCGWEFSNDKEDKDYSNVIYENLYIYCFCTKSADPLDDSDYFYDKLSKITSEIDSLEEAVYNCMDHTFVDEYREYQIKDDE